MLAPLRAASRTRLSARRQLASTSLTQANWMAATVTTRGAAEATDAATPTTADAMSRVKEAW